MPVPHTQRHPLYDQDRPIVNRLLLQQTPSDVDLIDCARLANRYSGFPGHPDMLQDLQRAAATWGFDRAGLNMITRRLWQQGFRPAALEEELLVGSGADGGAA